MVSFKSLLLTSWIQCERDLDKNKEERKIKLSVPWCVNKNTVSFGSMFWVGHCGRGPRCTIIVLPSSPCQFFFLCHQKSATLSARHPFTKNPSSISENVAHSLLLRLIYLMFTQKSVLLSSTGLTATYA